MDFFERWQKRAKGTIIYHLVASLLFFVVFGLQIETLFMVINQWWIGFSNLIPDYNSIRFLLPFRIKIFKENETLVKYEKTLKRIQISFIVVGVIGLIISLSYTLKIQVVYDFLRILGDGTFSMIFYLSGLCFFGCFYFSPQYIWSKAMSIGTLNTELRKSFAHTSVYYQIYSFFILRNSFSGIMSIFGIEWFNEFSANLILGAILSFLFYCVSIELPYWYGSNLHKKEKLERIQNKKNILSRNKEEENDSIMKVYYVLELTRLDQEFSNIKNESVHLHKGVLMIPVLLTGVIVNVVLTEILKEMLLF